MIDYIQKHREFSVHQHYQTTEVQPHLSHFKKQPVFKVLYYQGDEETKTIKEIDSVLLDSFNGMSNETPSFSRNRIKTTRFTSFFLYA